MHPLKYRDLFLHNHKPVSYYCVQYAAKADSELVMLIGVCVGQSKRCFFFVLTLPTRERELCSWLAGSRMQSVQ
jgi:hypothetical protein